MKPIKTDAIFVNAPGELGMLWSQLCVAENELAAKLQKLPLGTLAVLEGDAWYLNDDGDCLILCHANCDEDGETTDESNRFDIGLEWVDTGEDELQDYISRVNLATETLT